MKLDEFERVMAYVTAVIGHPLKAESMVVYFDLLGDLPFEVLFSAAKRVVLEHPWPNFPSVAELRSAAVLSIRGSAAPITAIEAWDMARKFGSKFDPESRGEYFGSGKTWPSQFDFLVRDLPPIVVKAIAAFGPLSLSVGKEPTGVLRAQFIDTFEQLVQSEQRAALLPPKLKESIEEGPKKALPRKVVKALEMIGKPTE